MKNFFKKNNYKIVKNAISTELANFCYEYFLVKRKVAKTMIESTFLSPYIEYFGKWGDEQVPGTYAHYSDIVMETLLIKILPIMEEHTQLKLYPNYSYARIYKKGDVLQRHKDRLSCEISTTLNLGGDPWPIYLEPSGKTGLKGIEVNLKPGDLLIYKGTELEHWREVFNGENCAQTFLHYSNVKSKDAKKNIYDGRPHLGLPNWFNGVIKK